MHLNTSVAPVALGRVPEGVILMAAPNVDALRARQAELQAGSEQLIAAADTAGRDLTDDELSQIEGNAAEVERIGRQIEARNRIEQASAGTGAVTRAGGSGQSQPQPGARPTVPAQPRDNRWGFQTLGDQAIAVRAATMGNMEAMQRLRPMAAATTYGNEGTGSEGGFLLAPEFAQDIAIKITGEDSLASRVDMMNIGGSSFVAPKDESAPWDQSDGISVGWEGEGTVGNESRGVFKRNTVDLYMLRALVKCTDQLLEDATGLTSYLQRKTPQKFVAKINTAIVAGNGVGMPRGIIGAPGTVVVDAESSQAADTILFENIVNMISRHYVTNSAAVVWLINQNTLPQLMRMRFDKDASSPVPVWLPANGLAGQRFSTLGGYPVIPVQACSKLGDQGDIILADMSQYMMIQRTGGMRQDVSIHLHFDQSITSFRFVMRMNGQPWWEVPITPENATETLSPFVTLAARA